MIINQLHLISYGKFKNKVIDLADGMNLIYGDNEAGKSTIMAFIKAMLYGFNGRGAESDRKRYIPWDGDALVGEMIFTANNGRRMIIQRKSGRLPSMDVCRVIDAVTGAEVKVDMEEEVGIGENGFLKTLYIRQLACSVSGGDDELTDKLINLAVSGDEDTGYHQASEYLKDKLKFHKHLRGDGGRIFELKQRITALNTELAQAEDENRKLIGHIARQETLEKEIASLRSRIAKTDSGTRVAQAAQAQVRIDRLEAARQRVVECERTRDEAQRQRIALEREKAQYAAFETDIDESVYTASQDVTDALDRLRQNRRIRGWALALACLILLFGIGVVFLKIIDQVLALVLLALCVVFACGCLAAAFILGARLRKLQRKIDIAKKSEESKTKEFAKFGCASLKEYTEMRAAYNLLQEKLRTARIHAEESEAAVAESHMALATIESSLNTEYGGAKNAAALNPSEAMREEAMLRDELNRRVSEVGVINGVLSASLQGKRSPDVIIAERYMVENELKDAEKQYSALLLAQETLADAFEELSQNFTPRINESASKYLSALTGKNGEELLVDRQYNITLMRNGARQLNLFSHGTIEQAYLAVRLAIVELVFGKNNTPVFFDDSFTQYDDTRTRNAVSLLQKIAHERQVVMFSCRPLPIAEDVHVMEI